MNARNKTEMRRGFTRMGVFTDRCSVLSETISVAASGGEIKSFTAATGLTSIPCIFLSQKTRKSKNLEASESQRFFRIKLNDNYPTIKPGMKVSCNSVDYLISDVSTEGTGVFTILDVERWN